MLEFGWSEMFHMVGLQAPHVKTGKKSKRRSKLQMTSPLALLLQSAYRPHTYIPHTFIQYTHTRIHTYRLNLRNIHNIHNIHTHIHTYMHIQCHTYIHTSTKHSYHTYLYSFFLSKCMYVCISLLANDDLYYVEKTLRCVCVYVCM